MGIKILWDWGNKNGLVVLSAPAFEPRFMRGEGINWNLIYQRRGE